MISRLERLITGATYQGGGGGSSGGSSGGRGGDPRNYGGGAAARQAAQNDGNSNTGGNDSDQQRRQQQAAAQQAAARAEAQRQAQIKQQQAAAKAAEDARLAAAAEAARQAEIKRQQEAAAEAAEAARVAEAQRQFEEEQRRQQQAAAAAQAAKEKRISDALNRVNTTTLGGVAEASTGQEVIGTTTDGTPILRDTDPSLSQRLAAGGANILGNTVLPVLGAQTAGMLGSQIISNPKLIGNVATAVDAGLTAATPLNVVPAVDYVTGEKTTAGSLFGGDYSLADSTPPVAFDPTGGSDGDGGASDQPASTAPAGPSEPSWKDYYRGGANIGDRLVGGAVGGLIGGAVSEVGKAIEAPQVITDVATQVAQGRDLGDALIGQAIDKASAATGLLDTPIQKGAAHAAVEKIAGASNEEAIAKGIKRWYDEGGRVNGSLPIEGITASLDMRGLPDVGFIEDGLKALVDALPSGVTPDVGFIEDGIKYLASLVPNAGSIDFDVNNPFDNLDLNLENPFDSLGDGTGNMELVDVTVPDMPDIDLPGFDFDFDLAQGTYGMIDNVDFSRGGDAIKRKEGTPISELLLASTGLANPFLKS